MDPFWVFACLRVLSRIYIHHCILCLHLSQWFHIHRGKIKAVDWDDLDTFPFFWSVRSWFISPAPTKQPKKIASCCFHCPVCSAEGHIVSYCNEYILYLFLLKIIRLLFIGFGTWIDSVEFGSTAISSRHRPAKRHCWRVFDATEPKNISRRISSCAVVFLDGTFWWRYVHFVLVVGVGRDDSLSSLVLASLRFLLLPAIDKLMLNDCRQSAICLLQNHFAVGVLCGNVLWNIE